MRPLSAAELLEVWERGQARSPTQRALSLLGAACPEWSSDALAQLSLGQRDARLLALREWTFGPQLVSVVTCPSCGARLELTFTVPEVRVHPEGELAETLSISAGGYEVSCRLPNSRDLELVLDGQNVAAIRSSLLQRCILEARREGTEMEAQGLPAEVLDAVVAEMARVDAQAEVELSLSCSSCGHQWPALFDILTFFWSELEAWALRLLREVHALASAYGWREADILAMSPWRRQVYVDMAGG